MQATKSREEANVKQDERLLRKAKMLFESVNNTVPFK